MSGRPSVTSVSRTILFWAHLVSGVVAGAIILVMSVTGVLLTYERQLLAWADHRAVAEQPLSEAPRRPVGKLLRAATAEVPDVAPTSMLFPSAAGVPMQVAFGRGRTVYLDPGTATVLGTGDSETRALFSAITSWHRWLGATDEGRDTARAITGAANLAFLFLVLSGLILWFPRRFTWTQFRAVLFFRRGLRGKARDFNWHNVMGVWSFVPLVVIVASGVVISYRWAGDLVYRIAGEAPPPPPPPRPAGGEARGPGGSGAGAPTAGSTRVAATPPYDAERLEALLAQAMKRVDGWRTIAMTLPTDAAAPVSFTIDEGTGGQPQRRSTLSLDPATGNETAWQPFASLSAGRKARSFLRFAHTGEYYGLVGQTIAGIVTLATAFLVWTGIALAWRRLLRMARRAPEGEVEGLRNAA